MDSQLTLESHVAFQALQYLRQTSSWMLGTIDLLESYLREGSPAILEQIRSDPRGLESMAWAAPLYRAIHPSLIKASERPSGLPQGSSGPSPIDLRILELCAAASSGGAGGNAAHAVRSALQCAAANLGPEASPILQVGLGARDPEVVRLAAHHLVALQLHLELVRPHLEAGLASDQAADWLPVAAAFGPQALEEPLWKALTGKSKALRRPTAKVLARLGDSLLPRVEKLLADKKADLRSAGVELLIVLGAHQRLEQHLQAESNEDVRDQVMAALAGPWKAARRQFSWAEVQGWAQRSPARRPAWISSTGPLLGSDGQELPQSMVDYLLYRQSRASGLEVDPEAEALLGWLDRSRGGPFADALLEAFVGAGAPSKEGWCLALVGFLGDDQASDRLARLIGEWGDSNQLRTAERGLVALGLNGRPRALEALDQTSRRYQSKKPSLGQTAIDLFEAAATREGLTPAQLGDRIVPWLGFAPGQARLLAEGVEVRIGPDLKLAYLDKGKPVKSLPKQVPEAPKQEMKALTSRLKEAVEVQQRRLENLMVLQHRWQRPAWEGLYLGHPLLLPLASRLVWTCAERTFRPLEDGSLTNAAGDRFELSAQASIGIAHPLELSDETVAAWKQHFVDYRLEPPFAQLDRPVVRLEPGQRYDTSLDCQNQSLNAWTFRGRVQRLGWLRGTIDQGAITSYRKRFPACELEACLRVGGMYVGVSVDESVYLEGLVFVPLDSVPAHLDPPRHGVALGEVPELVCSEALADVQRLLGASG